MKDMVTGRQRQLIKQVGEYLVAAELCRRELTATSFTGNVPIFDILALTSDNKMKTIQVKATTTNSGWNFNVADYLIFESSTNESQNIKGIQKLSNPDMIFCFVKLGSFGKINRKLERDIFYLVPIVELQKIIETKYSAFLEKVNHVRPRNASSHHIKIKPNDIVVFKENWDCISE